MSRFNRFIRCMKEQTVAVYRALGFHVHEPKLFVIKPYCVVKCTTCGNESIPWEIPPTGVVGEHHANDAAEMAEIDRRVKAI